MLKNIVSLFPNNSDKTRGENISIESYFHNVKNGCWQDEVINYRISKLNSDIENLQVVTFAGDFKERNQINFIKHSGIIAIEIAGLNESLLNVKAQLLADPYAFALFVNCSGNGLCMLTKINPKAHSESFNLLSEHLYKKYNLTSVNEKGADIPYGSFVSYDPDLYYNENSQPIKAKPQTANKKESFDDFVYVQDDFKEIIEQIKAKHLDLTADFGAWIKIGYGFVNKFQESGRDYFHVISQYNKRYDRAKTDRKFTNLLMDPRIDVSLGFFYRICQANGINVYSAQTRKILRVAKATKGNTDISSINKTLKEKEGFSDAEIKSIQPIVQQVLSEKVVLPTDNLILNIKAFIREHYHLRRNVISRNIELDNNPIDDTTMNSIFVETKTEIPKATKDLVFSILLSDFIPEYNPFHEFFAEYQDNPPEHPTGHIAQLISAIKTDTPNADLFIKKWLVSLIASINGFHSPLMLVLCGGQNTGKTHYFRNVLPKRFQKYYAESKLDNGKDDDILMTKKLIIMDDEMGGKSKQEQKKLKEMTSKQTFSIREPYGRVSIDLQRLAMLCGTTNDEQILNDPTGNRRILPVRVLDIDRLLFNSVNKDLLFYEAYLEYENGFNYNLTAEDIETLKQSSHEFKQTSMEQELVLQYYRCPVQNESFPIKEMTCTAIMSHLQIHSTLRLNLNKLGVVLKSLGFCQRINKTHNTTERLYSVCEL